MLPVSAHTSDCAGSAFPPARRHLSGGSRCSPTPAERVQIPGRSGAGCHFAPMRSTAAPDSGSVRDPQFVRCDKDSARMNIRDLMPVRCDTGSVPQYSRCLQSVPCGTCSALLDLQCSRSVPCGICSARRPFRPQLLSEQRGPPQAHVFHDFRQKQESCPVRQSTMSARSVLPFFRNKRSQAGISGALPARSRARLSCGKCLRRSEDPPPRRGRICPDMIRRYTPFPVNAARRGDVPGRGALPQRPLPFLPALLSPFQRGQTWQSPGPAFHCLVRSRFSDMNLNGYFCLPEPSGTSYPLMADPISCQRSSLAAL